MQCLIRSVEGLSWDLHDVVIGLVQDKAANDFAHHGVNHVSIQADIVDRPASIIAHKHMASLKGFPRLQVFFSRSSQRAGLQAGGTVE